MQRYRDRASFVETIDPNSFRARGECKRRPVWELVWGVDVDAGFGADDCRTWRCVG